MASLDLAREGFTSQRTPEHGATFMSGDWWDDLWGSVHEAAHAVTARHFGLTVKIASMTSVRILHRRDRSPDDRYSRERLIVAAAGDAATTRFLQWTDTGNGDDAVEFDRLLGLGADIATAKRLMREARRDADRLVSALRREIVNVARALRQRRTLSQDEIDHVSVHRADEPLKEESP